MFSKVNRHNRIFNQFSLGKDKIVIQAKRQNSLSDLKTTSKLMLLANTPSINWTNVVKILIHKKAMPWT